MSRPDGDHSSPSSTKKPSRMTSVLNTPSTKSSSVMSWSGRGSRKWTVRSTVGTNATPSRRENTGGGKASAYWTTSASSSGRGSGSLIHAPTRADSPPENGRSPSAQRRSKFSAKPGGGALGRRRRSTWSGGGTSGIAVSANSRPGRDLENAASANANVVPPWTARADTFVSDPPTRSSVVSISIGPASGADREWMV